MKNVFFLLMAVSVGLLGATAYGYVQDLPTAEIGKNEKRFDPDFAQGARDLDALHQEAVRRAGGTYDTQSNAEKTNILFGVVIDRFAHGENKHSFFSNWILWSMGQVVDGIGYARRPETVLRTNAGALCSAQSYVLLQLALNEGIPARHVGLNGHVVMEAWYDGAWRMYDPDYEVSPVDEKGEVLSVSDLERDAGIVMRTYGKNGKGMVKVYGTADDNTFATIPRGSHFNWKAQVLAYFELATEWGKFILPVMGFLIGLRGFGSRLRKIG